LRSGAGAEGVKSCCLRRAAGQAPTFRLACFWSAALAAARRIVLGLAQQLGAVLAPVPSTPRTCFTVLRTRLLRLRLRTRRLSAWRARLRAET
jgi:hypothetical protein